MTAHALFLSVCYQLLKAANLIHTGFDICNSLPVGSSLPVCSFLVNVTMLLPSRLATNRKRPSGETAKLRGCPPCVETYSTTVSLPVV